MARRKRIGRWSLAVLALAGCACSSTPGATPTAVHTPARPVPTTTVPTTTTTVPPPGAATTVPIPVVQAPGWSSALTTLPPGGGFSSLSCISDTFCIATGGGTGGQAAAGATTSGAGVTVSWDGASWSEPSVYFPAPVSGPVTAPILPSLTCTLGPTCVIVDGSDHVSTGNGTDWSTPRPLETGAATVPSTAAGAGAGRGPFASVACPTPHFCAVVDNSGHATTMQGGAWGATQSLAVPPSPPAQGARTGISCPTTTFCRAVVGAAVVDWNGTSWSVEPTPWTASPAAASTGSAISCPSTTLCAIVNGSGLTYRHGNGAWSPVEAIDPHGGLDAVDCPTTRWCVASDAGGSVLTWSGGPWSPPRTVLPAPTEYPGIGTSLSCTGVHFCMVMSADGDYSTYSDS